MRKVIVIEHITLDGIIQSPGRRDEDTENGFEHGGWIGHYSDEIIGSEIRDIMNSRFDLLLGRKTYDIWSKYWPYHNDIWPNVNQAVKYVVSGSMEKGNWDKTSVIKNDIFKEIVKLKESSGNDIHIWGSSVLVQTMLQYRLVDSLALMIYPVTLGNGKRLFPNEKVFDEYELVKCQKTEKGVIITEYRKRLPPP